MPPTNVCVEEHIDTHSFNAPWILGIVGQVHIIGFIHNPIENSAYLETHKAERKALPIDAGEVINGDGICIIITDSGVNEEELQELLQKSRASEAGEGE